MAAGRKLLMSSAHDSKIQPIEDCPPEECITKPVQGGGKPNDNEKIGIPANAIDIINNIVDEINQLKNVLNDAGSGNYIQMVQDVTVMVQKLVLIILKHVKPNG